MATVDELLLAIYPDSSQLTEEERAVFIDMASAQAGDLANLTTQGVAYLAAHKIALSGSVSGSNPQLLTGEKEGQLSRSYATPDVKGNLSQTKFGIEYMIIRDSARITFGHYVGGI